VFRKTLKISIENDVKFQLKKHYYVVFYLKRRCESMLEENLKKIIQKQKEVINELEYQMDQISKNNLIQENRTIKAELFRLQEESKNRLEEYSKMKEENKNLKNALYEQIYNEKISILNAMNNKVDLYYQDTVNREKNRLIEFSKTTKNNIQQMVSILKEHRISAEN
jgi:hypothetical protein